MSPKLLSKSFKIPEALETEVNKKVVAQGYGLKGKSRWISEAICKFLSCPDEQFILECIEYSQDLERLDKVITFRLTQEVESLLDNWALKARINMPMLEGVKSKIIRTAIIHGLLGSADSIKAGHQKYLPDQNATL